MIVGERASDAGRDKFMLATLTHKRGDTFVLAGQLKADGVDQWVDYRLRCLARYLKGKVMTIRLAAGSSRPVQKKDVEDALNALSLVFDQRVTTNEQVVAALEAWVAGIGARWPVLMSNYFDDLPTEMPAEPGKFWNNGGTLART